MAIPDSYRGNFGVSIPTAERYIAATRPTDNHFTNPRTASS